MGFLLNHLLSESAYRFPDKAAVIFKDASITYAELDRESNMLANCLLDLGIQRGDRVGIHLNRSIDSIVGAFGILKTGAVYVPIDPMCPSNRLHYIVNKCGIRILLTSKNRVLHLNQEIPLLTSVNIIIVLDGSGSIETLGESTRIISWNDIRESTISNAPVVNTIDSDLAYILFTSGSTGNPKGVMITHSNSLTFVNTASDFFNIDSTDKLSNICPLHFDMSVFDIFVACKVGATVVVIPEVTTTFPVKLLETISKNDITVWNSVPSALALLATYKNLDSVSLPSLRLVLFAGEPFPLKYLRRLQDCIPEARFCNMYGQTEANSSMYYWVERVQSDQMATLPIGKPLPNFDIFAIAENGNPVSVPGEEGELFVRASTVALGYWGEDDRTEKSFVKNPLTQRNNEIVYKTGDLVRLNADGNYMFLGRRDHMIKSRGYRIEIGEIETVMLNHPGIASAVVIPIPDELVGNRISAIVVPLDQGSLSKEDVLQHCSRHLPKYMIPELIHFRDSLPTTSSGKVDRNKLSQLDEIISCCRHT